MRTNYPVTETFYSLQGEGFHSGKSAYFIRLAGCDVGCTWCDQKETWSAKSADVVSNFDLANMANQVDSSFVVITGGEPTLYNLESLTREIKKPIHLETSGTRPITGQIDWVTLSPKTFKPVVYENYALANELKVVISNESDINFAVTESAKATKDCHLFLQPDWFNPDSMATVIEFIKLNPQWRLSLQTHKYIGVR